MYFFVLDPTESTVLCMYVFFNQGLVALASHVEILKLTIPCIVGHLPGIIHTIPLVLALMTVLKI
jgi:hypothetical protein